MKLASLPDVAAQASRQTQPLDWVGMCGVALPICIEGQPASAKVDAGVSLDDGSARGIHMSRLYLALELMQGKDLTLGTVQQVLLCFLESHEGLSQRAYLNIHTEYLLKRPALVSPLAGWKSYPISILARLENDMFHVELKIDVAYSSTCPCSAALARQLIQQQFIEDFASPDLDYQSVLEWLGTAEGIVATPHSQRSTAHLHVQLNELSKEFPFLHLIDQAEAALGTAVQTAVKRADEQAFALANGQNLMFCEDAARRLHGSLQRNPQLKAFSVKVVHAESLHAHDAVAQSSWSAVGNPHIRSGV
ncbi:GTP cyclohydrolase FolE2 [Pseudomonas sp. S25]|uniref:GTP cyclohydrolase FolE2 n=1 Tax=Pseudomonas maioricensis TaxID=1766623 RepID=A0ABS9ZFL9_9PSED|nr:GTP cyclohydrolase FolE2 [Pseudomonas sp. S25]MCI8208846.1 GTP cyclohydrolase FolE2 [Pseudomonas sp. S25]